MFQLKFSPWTDSKPFRNYFRYVDTFNKSGGSAVSLFQSPVPSAKPVAGSSPKFFIPSPATPTEEMVQNAGESMQEAVLTN